MNDFMGIPRIMRQVPNNIRATNKRYINMMRQFDAPTCEIIAQHNQVIRQVEQIFRPACEIVTRQIELARPAEKKWTICIQGEQEITPEHQDID